MFNMQSLSLLLVPCTLLLVPCTAPFTYFNIAKEISISNLSPSYMLPTRRSGWGRSVHNIIWNSLFRTSSDISNCLCNNEL